VPQGDHGGIAPTGRIVLETKGVADSLNAVPTTPLNLKLINLKVVELVSFFDPKGLF
jgi:hypothetical protein